MMRHSTSIWRERVVTLLLAWPFLVLFLADRGQLNADTKYDLTVDPRRLIDVALSTWDEASHGGWVSQQHAGYLWPSGPFFLITNSLPDWVQQRLWVALIITVGGYGARWAARSLDISAGAAIVAGLVYQSSPYLVPYLSRTSSMLLPWAAVGFLFGAALRARTHSAGRWITVVALIVATVGGVNTTAVAMVCAVPIIVFVVAVRTGEIGWGRCLGLSASTAVASFLASCWWVVAAVIGAAYGPNLLGFSETVRDVSSTSSGVEVFRGAGYWLTYVVEADGSPTSAAGRLLTEYPAVVAATFVVASAGLLGSIVMRWRHRSVLAALFGVSLLLAIGVHPHDDPSLFGTFALDWLPDGALTALRSSTRAIPMLSLVVAIGVARLFSHIRVRPPVAVLGVGFLSIAAPWFTLGYVVDPALARPNTIPNSWNTLMDELETVDRVLVLPGSEFSTFTWGHTQDPPWTSRTAVITRELLPLGSPDRMDLLLALDDAIQDGVLDVNTIAMTARQLDADGVWIAEDVNTDRYRTQPILVRDVIGADGLELVREVPGVGALFRLTPVVESQFSDAVVLWGGGRGAVAAASAGLVSSNTVMLRPNATMNNLRTIVTDADRSEVRQWRTSQATRGATGEPSDGMRDGVAQLTTADPIETTVRWGINGDWVVSATTYGDPFELEPERRASMAVDGNSATAWRVAHPETQPTISITGPLTHLEPQVVAAQGGITNLSVAYLARAGNGVIELTANSAGTFDALELPQETYSIEVTISGVLPGTVDAGLAELLPEQITEYIVVPPLPDTLADAVLTRWRANRPDLGRSDPEPILRRLVTSDRDREMLVSVVGVDRSAPGCVSGVLSIDGADVDIDAATGGSCNGTTLLLTAGEHVIETSADQVTLRDTADVEPHTCCVTRLDTAYNRGWEVSAAGAQLQASSSIGGATVVVTEQPVDVSSVSLTWAPDRLYRIAIVISAVTAVLFLFVILIDPGRQSRQREPVARNRVTRSFGRIQSAAFAALVTLLWVGWPEALVILVIIVVVPRSEWVFAVAVAAISAVVVAEVARDRPQHGIAWPQHFEVVHAPMTAALLAICCVVFLQREDS